MACQTMPWYECREGIFEIDEFDGSEVFVIVGDEGALVVDTGSGIGDLKGLIETRITDKPYIVACTHNHADHIGGAGWFSPIYIHPADMDYENGPVAPTMEARRWYADLIAKRENKYYAYDPEADIRPWPKKPELLAMEDGQVFDLGNRRVTAYHCPGHTPGEMVFLDEKTGTLLCGDAFNCNWLLGIDDARTALEAMKRIYAMRDRYSSVYNSHHDFRGFGSPLSPDVVPNLITCLEQILAGTAQQKEIPDALSAGKTKIVSIYKNVYISGITKPEE